MENSGAKKKEKNYHFGFVIALRLHIAVKVEESSSCRQMSKFYLNGFRPTGTAIFLSRISFRLSIRLTHNYAKKQNKTDFIGMEKPCFLEKILWISCLIKIEHESPDNDENRKKPLKFSMMMNIIFPLTLFVFYYYLLFVYSEKIYFYAQCARVQMYLK